MITTKLWKYLSERSSHGRPFLPHIWKAQQSIYAVCSRFFNTPQETELLARHLAEAFKDDQVGLVVGPAMGGIIVAMR